MVTAPRRGEIWWGELEEVGRRPFLVLTRTPAIPVLHGVVAAPITRTVRGIPSELPLGPADGMPVECAASFDNVCVVSTAHLTERLCTLSPVRMVEACGALRVAVDC